MSRVFVKWQHCSAKAPRFDLEAWAKHCNTWRPVGPSRLDHPSLNVPAIAKMTREHDRAWFDRHHAVSGLLHDARMDSPRFSWADCLLEQALYVGLHDLWHDAWRESDSLLWRRVRAAQAPSGALPELAHWCRLKSHLMKSYPRCFVDAKLPIRRVPGYERPFVSDSDLHRVACETWAPLEEWHAASTDGMLLSSIVLNVAAPLFSAADVDDMRSAVDTLPLLHEGAEVGLSNGRGVTELVDNPYLPYPFALPQVVNLDRTIRLAWKYLRIVRPSGMAPPPEPEANITGTAAMRNCLDAILAWAEALAAEAPITRPAPSIVADGVSHKRLATEAREAAPVQAAAVEPAPSSKADGISDKRPWSVSAAQPTVYAYLQKHPYATAKAIEQETGIPDSTVCKTEAWKRRRHKRRNGKRSAQSKRGTLSLSDKVMAIAEKVAGPDVDVEALIRRCEAEPEFRQTLEDAYDASMANDAQR